MHVVWLARFGVHLALLNGSEQKISTFVDRGWNLLTGQRDRRIIRTDEDIEAGQSGQGIVAGALLTNRAVREKQTVTVGLSGGSE